MDRGNRVKESKCAVEMCSQIQGSESTGKRISFYTKRNLGTLFLSEWVSDGPRNRHRLVFLLLLMLFAVIVDRMQQRSSERASEQNMKNGQVMWSSGWLCGKSDCH